MSKIKNFLLALCVGVVSALIYDALFPEYKYFKNSSLETKEFTKEAYLIQIKEDSSRRFIIEKQVSLKTFLLGAVVTVAMLVVDPLKRKI